MIFIITIYLLYDFVRLCSVRGVKDSGIAVEEVNEDPNVMLLLCRGQGRVI